MSEYYFTSERLGFRNWELSDYSSFIELNKDGNVMEFFPSILSERESQDMIERIEIHIDKYGYGLYAVETLSGREFIGFIGLSAPRFEASFTPCIEIGWRLAHKFWNNGYATEGSKAVLGYAKNQLKMNLIYSFTAVSNTRSENVMKKIGMKFLDFFDHPNMPLGHHLSRHLIYVWSAR